jgi:hypothetical protein
MFNFAQVGEYPELGAVGFYESAPQVATSPSRRTRSSLSAPRITILTTSSGKGRCNAFASSHGAHPNVPCLIGRQDQLGRIVIQNGPLCEHAGLLRISDG